MARRNTGTIRQKRPGVFQVAVDLSKVRKLTRQDWASPVNRHRRYETVEGTREDAERRLHEMQYEADRGTLPRGNMTLNIWLDWWLREFVEAERRESTARDYHMQVRNYISPMLGSMYLHEIKAHHIREFQNRLAQKGLSNSTVRKIRQVVSGAMREAYNNDLIPANPVGKVPAPKQAKKKTYSPSIERVQHLLAEAGGHKYFAAFRLIAYTGMRVGEALGLEWRHVDLVKGIVHVEQAVVTNAAKTKLGLPKSESGIREIPIDPETVRVLLAHRERQDARRERMGEGYQDLGLVFPNPRGRLMHTDTILQALRKFAPELRTHDLRHFFATQIMEAGVALPRIRDLLGHSSIAVTANTYIHPDAAGDRDAIDLLAARMTAANGGAMAAEALDALLSNTN